MNELKKTIQALDSKVAFAFFAFFSIVLIVLLLVLPFRGRELGASLMAHGNSIQCITVIAYLFVGVVNLLLALVNKRPNKALCLCMVVMLYALAIGVKSLGVGWYLCMVFALLMYGFVSLRGDSDMSLS